jgi:DNA-binding transcriptional LysR family regulator
MKLHQLRAIVAISESGSIQEASRLLHISQPALSKSIKELEAELGVSLLARSNRGITVTKYGEHLVRRARLIVAEVRRAREEIDTLKGVMDGKVAIGVSPATPGKQFVTSLNSYRKRYPKVQLQIHELRPAKLLEGLREGFLDLMLTSQPPSRNAEGFHWVELQPQPAALVVRKGHPLRHAKSLKDLCELDWLIPDAIDESLVGQMFREHNIALPNNIIECASAVLYVELVSTTDAVGCLSLRVLESTQLLLQHGLETLDIVEQVPGMNISMVCRDPELMTREAQALADEVSYAFKSQRPPSELIGNTQKTIETASSLLHSPITVIRS